MCARRQMPISRPISRISAEIIRKQKDPHMALNIEKLSLKDLNDLEAKLVKAKQQVRDKAKVETKDKIDRILEASGFSIGDLYGTVRGGRGGRAGKSVAKYANPEDKSQTWTGRGRKPNWLNARLKKGANLEDFAI